MRKKLLKIRDLCFQTHVVSKVPAWNFASKVEPRALYFLQSSQSTRSHWKTFFKTHHFLTKAKRNPCRQSHKKSKAIFIFSFSNKFFVQKSVILHLSDGFFQIPAETCRQDFRFSRFSFWLGSDKMWIFFRKGILKVEQFLATMAIVVMLWVVCFLM